MNQSQLTDEQWCTRSGSSYGKSRWGL